MARFLQRADLEAAGLSAAVADAVATSGALTPVSLPGVLPPILGGFNYKPDRFRIITPDGGSDNGSLINDSLAALDDAGGGTLILDSNGAAFPTNQTIVNNYNSVSIASKSGKEVLSFQKGNAFPDGDTLLSSRGSNAGGNTGSAHTSSQFLTGFGLSGRSPNGTMKAGYLLDTSYCSAFRYDSLQFRRCPNTAWYREEEWDAVASDLRFINCGGPNGTSDANMRIVNSAADSSNNLVHFGTWFETFPHMSVSLEVGASSAGVGPYNIQFWGTKIESTALVNGAVMFRAHEKSRGVLVIGTFLAPGGVDTVGGIVYGIENNGKNSFTEKMLVEVRASDFSSTQRKPTLGWAARGSTSASESGGGIRDIQVGPNTAAVNALVYLPNQNLAGGALDYQGRFEVNFVRGDNLAWPLLTGPGYDAGYGVNTTGVRVTQNRDVPGVTQVNNNTSGTLNATFRKGHFTNRQPMGLNFAIAGTATIPPSVAAIGDVGEVVQEGPGAITVTPFSGVTLDVPTGLSATTAGTGRSVRVRCLGTNAYRVIG